ncbi:MAG TPA: ornithine carbamoyltransferase [Ktedonobacteraceae bacterium]
MSLDLRKRHFLTLDDFTPQEIDYLLQLSAELKAAKYAGREEQRLCGKNIALIFEKDSTRTRCAFEVAAFDQGAHVTYIGSSGSHIGYKETMKDTARVLGRMYHGIEYRGAKQAIVEELARYAGVPVWNGLTAESHPTQALADLLTMREHAEKPLNEISFCFLGDTGFNVCDSLTIGGIKLGMDVRLAGPAEYWPSPERIAQFEALASTTGARLMMTEDPFVAVDGCDFVHTDVWVSMGEPAERWEKRVGQRQMLPYQVNSQLMARTNNPGAKFMHCLPAFHNTDTAVGRQIYEQYGLDALEVTDEVFESSASIVFDQAENRLHTIKAVLVATL